MPNFTIAVYLRTSDSEQVGRVLLDQDLEVALADALLAQDAHESAQAGRRGGVAPLPVVGGDDAVARADLADRRRHRRRRLGCEGAVAGDRAVLQVAAAVGD